MFKWLNQPLGKSKQRSEQPSGQLFGLRFGKKKQETEQLPPGEPDGNLERQDKAPQKAPPDPLRWLGQQFERIKQKGGQLREREASDLVIQDDTQEQPPPDSLRVLLKTAIADAEQIAASIKMRAQKEAEAEAARIIAQTKLEAQEIMGRAEIAAEKQAEDILSAADRKVELTEVEAKHKALQFLIRASEEIEKDMKQEYDRAYTRLSSVLQELMNEGQNIRMELRDRTAKLWESKSAELKGYEAMLLSTSEAAVSPAEVSAPAETELGPDTASKEMVEEPVQLQEEALEEKVEEPAQLQEEALEEKVEEPVASEVVEETREAILEQHLPEETEARREPISAPLPVDSQAVYGGEVELIIASPVELKLVSRLYNYLQTIPELRILYTRGSWDQGTTITVVLEKPMPLISIIAETPGVDAIPELLKKDDLAAGKSGFPLRSEKRGEQAVKLTLKEAQPS